MNAARRPVDAVAQAQARVLVGELERIADALIEQIDGGAGGDEARRELYREPYEVREYVRRLQHDYEGSS